MKNLIFLICLIPAFILAKRQVPERVISTKEQLDSAKKIEHLIVIFQENWSFDTLYGNFPHVNGLKEASLESKTQVDIYGVPYPKLPVCMMPKLKVPYPQISQNLPNAPFDLSPYIPMTEKSGNIVHRFYQELFQIAEGRMNQFVLWGNTGGLPMSYYDVSTTAMGSIAKEFVICDHWFHSCYGGSLCGVLWLFAAQMPVWKEAPLEITATVYPSGVLIKDGIVSPDGFVINDAQPFYPPHKKGIPDHRRIPPQKAITIGDKLNEKGISWGWYTEGWEDAEAGNPDPFFSFHHQAPLYYEQFAPGTALRKEHLLDMKHFYAALDTHTLPAVSFIRSLNNYSEHPAKSNLIEGLDWCADLIKKIQDSSSWDKCLIIVTYDENGGRWDHVAPPIVDQFGPATRVPAVIISPFAKRGYVDHTSYETVSILKFIEERWDLEPCSTRDAAANNILNALQ
ncbi:MAG: alkaline phosphatase family protein [Chlamydiota bacterium]